MQEGLRFIFGHKVILNALALDMFSVLFGGAVALLPVFAEDILQVGPQAFGCASSSIGWCGSDHELALVAQGTGESRVQLCYGLLQALGDHPVVWYQHQFLPVVIPAVSQRAFDSVSVIIRANIIQLETPDEMRGRVSAVKQYVHRFQQ